ncbi:hypothetical protein J6590_069904 [Homalodisca vitripennis]|nr:hypothetical protein J6590_069904 [Homalodisca vitripennis]
MVVQKILITVAELSCQKDNVLIEVVNKHCKHRKGSYAEERRRWDDSRVYRIPDTSVGGLGSIITQWIIFPGQATLFSACGPVTSRRPRPASAAANIHRTFLYHFCG